MSFVTIKSNKYCATGHRVSEIDLAAPFFLTSTRACFGVVGLLQEISLNLHGDSDPASRQVLFPISASFSARR